MLDGNTSDGYTRNNIKEVNELYDCFIVGSDQVWSPFCTGGDLTYFLDFVSEHRKEDIVMFLFRTLLNRNMWMNPLSDVMGDWWIWKTEADGTVTITTECFKNLFLC